MKHTFTDKDPLIHFPFYINQYQGILSRYSLEEKGAFISLLCVFLSEDGKFPDDENQILRMCLAFSDGEKRSILSVMDKVIEVGQEILKNQRDKRQKCREAASKGGLARVANAQANATETLKHHLSNTENREQIQRTEIEIKKDIKPKGLIRPTMQKVSDYCRERHNSVNPNQFLNFYESNGWKVGKNPMKDWKAAVRTWENNLQSTTLHNTYKPINKAQEKTRQTMETIFNADLS